LSLQDLCHEATVMPKSIHDVDSILQKFQSLEDPRVNVNRRHLLGDLIVICIMAVITGADGPLAIGTWAENNKQWLTKRLQLPHGIPSHDTIGRLLAALKPSVFQRCFESWIASVSVPDFSTIEKSKMRSSPSTRRVVSERSLRRSLTGKATTFWRSKAIRESCMTP